MSKFCTNCGQEVPEETNYCTKCGASLNNDQTTNNGNTVIINNYNNNNNLQLPNRNIALAVIFSIITCGIYGVYWFIVLFSSSMKFLSHFISPVNAIDTTSYKS